MRSKLGKKIETGLLEIIDFAEGRGTARVTKVRVDRVQVPPSPPEFTGDEIQKIRLLLNMSQAAFGKLLEVSPRTVQSWESNHRRPTASARRLIQFITDPKLLRKYSLKVGDRELVNQG